MSESPQQNMAEVTKARLLVLAAALLWSTSGVFKFNPGESGVETLCGALPLPPG